MLTGAGVRAVLVRPSLWIEGLRALVAMSPPGWWRRGLPKPEADYAMWRVSTAYGKSDAVVAPEDLVAYLRWRKRQRAERGWGG